MSKQRVKPAALSAGRPNEGMVMSAGARMRMQATERKVYKYYNDMGPNKGNCTWGTGILAHKGVCSAEELLRKVDIKAVELEFGRRVATAEQIVRRNTQVPLNQAQFDAMCSLTFNTGADGAHDTFAFINRGDFEGAAANISKLIKVSVIQNGKRTLVVARGLIQRRAEESAPFRTRPVK